MIIVHNKKHSKNSENEELARKLIKTVNTILDRYKRYSRLIGYPGDWGERAFRAWLAYEVFHILLQWPIENIVFGEVYDILLVDAQVRPVIYVETKKPEITLTRRLLDKSIERANHFFSIQYVLLTNGIDWHLYDLLKDRVERVNIKRLELETIGSLLNKLHGKYYCEA